MLIAWACLKGKDAYYLAIIYGTEGNCDNCVWIEIMNRKGEVVDRSIKDINTDNHKQYKKNYQNWDYPNCFQLEWLDGPSNITLNLEKYGLTIRRK
jgi:hypothetical protein